MCPGYYKSQENSILVALLHFTLIAEMGNGSTEVWVKKLISHIWIILTGPIIVACQWNTETNKGVWKSLASKAAFLMVKSQQQSKAYSHLPQGQQNSGRAGHAVSHLTPEKKAKILTVNSSSKETNMKIH